MEKVAYNAEDVVSHDGVAAVIKNAKGDILMQKHVKFGFWTIPVGKVKAGQSVLDGLKEELKEECGITVLSAKELLVRPYAYNRDGHEVVVTSHLFEIEAFGGEICNVEPHKHEEQLFIPLEHIRSLPYLSDLTLLYLELLGIHRSAHLA